MPANCSWQETRGEGVCTHDLPIAINDHDCHNKKTTTTTKHCTMRSPPPPTMAGNKRPQAQRRQRHLRGKQRQLVKNHRQVADVIERVVDRVERRAHAKRASAVQLHTGAGKQSGLKVSPR